MTGFGSPVTIIRSVNTVGDDFSDLSADESCRGILIALLNAGLLELSISVSNSSKAFIDQKLAQLYCQQLLLKITCIMAKVEYLLKGRMKRKNFGNVDRL